MEKRQPKAQLNMGREDFGSRLKLTCSAKDEVGADPPYLMNGKC